MSNYDFNTITKEHKLGDNKIKIYNKKSKLTFSLNPNIIYFCKSANCIIIKIKDCDDVSLDFPSATEASKVLCKLNKIKKDISSFNINNKSIGTNTIFSNNNINMHAKKTYNDGDLACDNGIVDIPTQTPFISVLINGVEVNVGGNTYPYDCYFSIDGPTPRIRGDERKNDKLYWNGSVSSYNLNTSDSIDFIYLTKI